MTNTREVTVVQKALEGTLEHEVVVQKWEESERGWGTRPDGYSLHLTEDDRTAYEQDYWADMPDEIQDEYSRTCGEPYKAFVDGKTFEALNASKNGTRHFDNNFPGTGGSDGWKSAKQVATPEAPPRLIN